MDGENNGTPYEQMDDLGGFYTPIFGSTPIFRAMIQRPVWKKRSTLPPVKICRPSLEMSTESPPRTEIPLQSSLATSGDQQISSKTAENCHMEAKKEAN